MSITETLRKALIKDPSQEQTSGANDPEYEGGVFGKIKRKLIEPDDGKPQSSVSFVTPPQPQPPSVQTPAASNPQAPTAPAQPSVMPSWLQSPQPPIQPAPVQQTAAQQPGGASLPSTPQGSTQVTGASPQAPAASTANTSGSGGASSPPPVTLTAGSIPALANPPPETPPAPEAPPAQSAPPSSPPVKISFGAIYEAAGYASVPFTAEKVLDFVGRLPPELSMDQKQLTVMAWLEAMGRDLGATSETIVADARGKVAILTSHVDNLSTQTRHLVGDTSAEITALQAQIEEKRKAIEEAQRKEAETSQACQAEANRLQIILKFFGADTTPPNSP